MKKILVIMLVALSGLASVNASDFKEYEVLYKVNEVSTFRNVVKYINANEDQVEAMKYINSLTERKLNNAIDKNSEAAAEKALMFHLGNVKNVLTNDQYKKYLVILNVSMLSNYEEYLAVIK